MRKYFLRLFQLLRLVTCTHMTTTSRPTHVCNTGNSEEEKAQFDAEQAAKAEAEGGEGGSGADNDGSDGDDDNAGGGSADGSDGGDEASEENVADP